jgi:outer membrane protein
MIPIFRLFWSIVPLMAITTTGCTMMHSPRTARIEDYLTHSALEKRVAATPTIPNRANQIDETMVKERPLTLAACVQIALNENPTRRAAQEGVAAARESVGMAKSLYYPTVGLDAAYQRWETHAFLPEGLTGMGKPSVIGPTDDWSSGLSARYLLFDSGRRAAELRTALSRQGIAEEDEASIRQDIAMAVHQAFYNLLSTMEAQAVAEQNRTRAEDHLRLTTERWEAGAVAKADVIRAQVEVADAKLQLVRSDGAISLARGSLNTAMGLPVEMKVALDVENRNMDSPDKIDVTGALNQAVERRPELKAALHRIEASRNSIDVAKSAFGPTITANAGYGYRDSEFLPEDKDWSAGVGIALPLFEGFKRSHDVSRAKHELAKEEAEIRHLVLKVREEVWVAQTKLKEFREATQASEAVVRDARESMRMTRERYEAGVATATDLLDAQTTLARAEYLLVEARWSYFSARAALHRAMGTILDNGN